jgi:hypothetical protein
MQKPKILQAFDAKEHDRAHRLLASKVTTMMGRKFEEGDWSDVYCKAKNIPVSGWSNLSIDVMHANLGVEHKMLCVKSTGEKYEIRTYCGERLMHPAATRSIRIPNEADATKAAREVLKQYSDLIARRAAKVAENASGKTPDMRTGWLLWQEELRQFLYFEEEMLAPNPKDFYAEWRDSGSTVGTRKASKNLWVYESETGIKRYSITTSAGAKIQPYFDVPAPTEPNLYVFTVQGELLGNGLVRIWVTQATADLLKQALGNLETNSVSALIQKVASALPEKSAEVQKNDELAIELTITPEAYKSLETAFVGISDEHRFQLLVRHLRN